MSNEDKITKKIVFCINNGTSSISIEFLKNWTELCCKCLQNNIKPILSINGIRDEFLNYNKMLGGENISSHQKIWGNRIFSDNILLKETSKIDCDYICFINPNISFNYNNLKQLINADKEFISAICTSQLENNRWNYSLEWDYEEYIKEGIIERTYKNIPVKNTLLEIYYTDLDFVLVKPELFNDLEYPWFKPITDYLNNGVEFLSTPADSFCRKLINNGKNLWVHTDCKIYRIN